MKSKRVFLILAVCCATAATVAGQAASVRVPLSDGWRLQSSAKIKASGEEISARTFAPSDWLRVTVPTTVVAAQVALRQLPDPYYGMNLRKFPGMDYAVGDTFALRPMSPSSPYAVSWWYRKTFVVPPSFHGKKVWLHFDGINYRANIWLNGHKLADSDQIAGTFRRYELDATPQLVAGENVLAVQVFAQTEKDLGIDFWDWNPEPPDKDMGLYGDVYLTASGPVTVRFPQVVSKVAPDLQSADLTVMAELRNAGEQPVDAVLEATLEESHVHLQQPVTLKPGEARTVTFAPQQFPALHVGHPELWWPWPMGQPRLQHVSVRVSSGGAVSDAQRIRFGIREVSSDLGDKKNRIFRVNGKPILIRGGGWTSDMLLRHNFKNLEAQFQLVRDLGLNTIRLEGKMETDDFFDLADEQGVLIMAGWMCCDIWQDWAHWPPENKPVAMESQRTQLLRLRSHPSMLVWLSGSDEPPPPDIERAFDEVVKETAWPNPSLSTASDRTTPVNGLSGVKMSGPYDWVPPSYWYADKFGGAFGFNTETSAGAAIPPMNSLRKFIPADHLWPIDDEWNFHAGSENFANLQRFTRPLATIYGTPTTLDDFERKAQALTYENERAMFEAYGKNKYVSTGVIQWMLNNAWPSLYWHLYDFYLQPAGGYFGAKKANEPVHVQYDYLGRSVAVVNSTYERVSGLHVSARLYDFDLKEAYKHDAQVDVDADGVQAVVTLPDFAKDHPSPVYFLELEAKNAAGKTVSSNFYWLPQSLAVLDWDKTDWRDTPTVRHEDFTALQQLQPVRLTARASMQPDGSVRVVLRNATTKLAFQTHAAIGQSHSDDEILPVLWSDNYVSLLPGETRELVARFPQRNAKGRLELRVDGWNVERVVVPLGAGSRQGK